MKKMIFVIVLVFVSVSCFAVDGVSLDDVSFTKYSDRLLANVYKEASLFEEPPMEVYPISKNKTFLYIDTGEVITIMLAYDFLGDRQMYTLHTYEYFIGSDFLNVRFTEEYFDGLMSIMDDKEPLEQSYDIDNNVTYRTYTATYK